MKREWRRRNYFIKKELQGRYIFKFFIFVIIGSILFTIIFSLLSAGALTIVYDNYNLKVENVPFALLKEMLGAHWIFIVSCGFIITAAAMFFTHRFAGPLYRFEKTLDEMIKGNFDCRIRLRKHDECKELAQKINMCNRALSSNLEEMRHLVEKIDGSLLKISEQAGISENPEEAVNNINQTILLSKRVKEILSHFKLQKD